MERNFADQVNQELADIRKRGLHKTELPITSPQQDHVVVGTRQVLNLCANNYLGLTNNLEIISVVKEGLDARGFGMASVRFICGTQDIHRELEKSISAYLGKDDTILYSSCFDANGGLFETLLNQEDAIISDALNHAFIIDGIRLCKAERYRYAHSNMDELEAGLVQAQKARRRIIATDGVFSMDGDFAKLDEICRLAEHYQAWVMVDDSHATGFVGSTGRSTLELYDVLEMYETWYKMTAMIQTGLDISPTITHRFQYTDYQQALEIMASGQSGKVILDWAV